MNKFIPINVSLLCLWLLTGCTGVSKSSETPLTQIVATSIISTPTSTLFVEATQYEPERTIASTISLQTSTPTPTKTDRCWDVDTSRQIMSSLHGVLVLEQSDVLYEELAYLLDLESNLLRPIPAGSDEFFYSRYAVSPDGKLLAYEKLSKDLSTASLVVVDMFWKQQAEIQLEGGEYEYGWWGYWVNNESLLIRNFRYSLDGRLTGEQNERIVNIFTGQERIFKPVLEFPDYSLSWAASPPVWKGWAMYAPDVHLAVYPAQPEMSTVIRLYDSENKKEIGEFSGAIPSYVEVPTWSPNGDAFTVILRQSSGETSQEGLFIISSEGAIIQVIGYTELEMDGGFGYLSWSPDGKKIAFWFWRGYDESLAILDLETMQVTDTCLLAGYTGNPALPPLWGEDSHHIIIGNRATPASPPRVVAIDLDRQTAWELMDLENHDPVGWLRTTP